MCFCCCITRKGVLIYSIIISALAFIYGIIEMAEFASKTNIYKYLITVIDYIEENGNNLGAGGYNPLFPIPGLDGRIPTAEEVYEYSRNIFDTESMNRINSFTYDYLSQESYGFVKSLKGIENGLGVILFVFALIFLAAAIVYLIFAWGIKETRVMRTKIFNIFNIIKIITYTLSIIFIFLSVLYGTLLIVALVQYVNLLKNLDSCAVRILIGIIFGYYCFWYYIILACAFGKEHNLFKLVGSEANPGPKAEYELMEILL